MHRLIPAAVLAILLAAGCGQPGPEPASSEPGEPSAGRTPVIVYSPHGADIERDAKERWEQAQDRWELVCQDMGATAVLDRLEAEQRRPQADVWWGGPASVMLLGARHGLLAPYRPTWADQVEPHQRDPEDRWYGVLYLPLVLGYSRDLWKPEDLPTTWDELAEPRWAGHLVLRHPLASGTMTTFFTARFAASLEQTGSVDSALAYLRGLDANTGGSYAPDPQRLYDTLARDPAPRFTVWGVSDLVYQARKESSPYPFAYRTLEGDTPTLVDGIALVAGSPHPEGARAFYEFATSPEMLQFLAVRHNKIPLRRDLPPDQLPEWMTSLHLTPQRVDLSALADHTREWMGRWDKEVRGKGR